MPQVTLTNEDYRNDTDVAMNGAIAGFTNFGKFGIESGLVRLFSNTAPKYMRLNSSKTTFDANPTGVSARDVEFWIDFPIIADNKYPTGVETIIQLRRDEVTNTRVDVYISPGSKLILVQHTRDTAGMENAPAISANFLETAAPGTRFRLKMSISGAKAATTFTVKAFTLDAANGETAYNEWSGSNTKTVNFNANNTAEYGVCIVTGNYTSATNCAHFDGFRYMVEGDPSALNIALPTITVSDTSISLAYADATGGTPSYTYSIHDISSGASPSVGNRISTTKNATITGLTPDTVYRYAMIVTDSVSGTYRLDVTPITLKKPKRKLLAYGDSTTQGGTPRWYQKAAEIASEALGYTVETTMFSVPGSALSGWSEQTYLDLYAAINSFGASIVIGQPGILDGASTVQDTSQLRIDLAESIIDNCPTVVASGIQHHNMTYSPYTVAANGFDGFVYSPATHTRNRQIQAKLIELNQGRRREYQPGKTVWIAPSSEYDPDLNHPEYYNSDGLHKAEPSGYAHKGHADAAFLMEMIQDDWETSSGGGGGGGGAGNTAPGVLHWGIAPGRGRLRSGR